MQNHLEHGVRSLTFEKRSETYRMTEKGRKAALKNIYVLYKTKLYLGVRQSATVGKLGGRQNLVKPESPVKNTVTNSKKC